METRTIEVTGVETEALPLSGIRWAAIFAGLAVGLAVTLLLMLIGMATGLAVYGAGERLEGSSVSLAAGLWNSVSMFIAALVGGFVAARASGLRRRMDGMLHGVVSWGATMLCFAILTGALTGNAVGGAFGLATYEMTSNRSETTMGDLLAALERGDRMATINTLRDRFGLTQDQASSAADRAMALSGRSASTINGGAGTTTDDNVTDTARAASLASAWLSVVIFLSLVAGAGGGVLGARAVRRRALPGRFAEQRVAHGHTAPGVRIPSAG